MTWLRVRLVVQLVRIIGPFSVSSAVVSSTSFAANQDPKIE